MTTTKTHRTIQGQILSYRLGLDDGITHTLEDTGRKFGITRERVRQIYRLYEKEQERSKKTLLEMVDAGIVLQLS